MQIDVHIKLTCKFSHANGQKNSLFGSLHANENDDWVDDNRMAPVGFKRERTHKARNFQAPCMYKLVLQFSISNQTGKSGQPNKRTNMRTYTCRVACRECVPPTAESVIVMNSRSSK